MAGINLYLYIQVAIKMNGQKVVEHDDPDADKTKLQSPFACCKLIEIKENASFSIDILFGRGIRGILSSDDSALMTIVHLGSQEVIKRLVTKKTLLSSGKARQHRLLLEGVYEKVGKSRQTLKRFRFATRDKNGNIVKGSIKVDFHLVRLLSQAEREPLLVDMASSGPPPQTISFETNENKKPQAADTYEVDRLNHGHPFASFIFKYETKGTLPAGDKPKCNNESTDEDLIDLTDVQSALNAYPALGKESSLRKTSGTILLSESSPDAAWMASQVHTVAKLFDDLLTLVDSDEEKAEMNRIYLPLQTKGFLADMGEKTDHAKTEDDEAISIQSVHDTKPIICKKRKAASAFGESSPPRPWKMIALSE